jgi:MtN3 and saliva related transmembrane protein
MNLTPYVGFFAGVLTSGAALPQVMQTYRTKHARDLSMAQLVLLCLGMLLWLIYGLAIGDFPLIAANIFSICCYLSLIFMKLQYDRRDTGVCTDSAE